jgi:glycosyltransferase involved in cell wall biosynthesis
MSRVGKDKPLRAIYFTIVDVGRTDNGGGLVCRHHISEIARADGISLTVCTAGEPSQFENQASFFNSTGVAFRHIPFLEKTETTRRGGSFFFEALASSQKHVDAEFAAWVSQSHPDVLLIDYLPSAALVPSAYSGRVPRITITLNSEARYFRDLQRLRRGPRNASMSLFAGFRFARFERSIYRKSNAVVALTKGDLPKAMPLVERRVIPPLFPPAERRWTPKGQGHIFFVGNRGHYPNALAIEWLATQFGPALESLGSTARLRIIGADRNSVPSHWLRKNIDYLGIGDRTVVEDEFICSDLFVAPLANAFGSKMKVLECLSYGTPVVATQGALSGLPFLKNIPIVHLERPEASARLVISLLADPTRLRAISAQNSNEVSEQLKLNSDRWSRLIRNVTCAPGLFPMWVRSFAKRP